MKRFLLVLAACGSHGGGDAAPAKRVADAGAPRPLSVHLPPVAGATSPTGAAPAAVITIAADGTIMVAPTGGSWDAIASGVPSATPVTLADVPHAVLEAELAAGGAWAERAKSWIASLDTVAGPDAAGLDDAGEADISMTYFTPVGEIEEPTPVIVADPRAPGTLLANVLDEVGGEIAVDGGGHLGLLAIGAPWTAPGFGGLDAGDDRPSIDIMVGRNKLLTADDFGPGKVIDPDPKQLAPALTGAPTATIDLLITGTASVGELVTAVNAAHTASPSQTTGVGVTPFAFPQPGMDGQVDPGPIGVPSHVTVADVQTADHDYAVILTRFVRRALAQLATCTASGKVTVHFAIDTAGNLSKVSGAPPCITDVFAHLTVARPAANASATVVLDYP